MVSISEEQKETAKRDVQNKAALNSNANMLLNKVGDIRGGLTFLVDPETERKLIKRALVDQLGRHYLSPHINDSIEQQLLLQKNLTEFLSANANLKLGNALTQAQRDKLNKPLLWYVTRKVNGVNKLVPELILPKASYQYNPVSSITAKNITLDIKGKAYNSGNLNASGKLTINAGSFVNEKRFAWATTQVKNDAFLGLFGGGVETVKFKQLQAGGLITAGQVNITTQGDFKNIGGQISSLKDGVIQSLNGDVINTAAEGQVVSTWSRGNFGALFGKNSHDIGKDFESGRISSGGKLSLVATKGSIRNIGSHLSLIHI